MPDIFGRAYWPGVSDVNQCSYTCTHGITPNAATLLFPLEDIGSIQRRGNLVFTDGEKTWTLMDCSAANECKIVESPGGGKCAQIMISDRRWKWRFGYVSAAYNRRNHRGEPLTELKSPYDIAEFLLRDQMKESNYQIDLPAGLGLSDTPLIEWDMVRPAEALANLAERFGRVVVYQPISNRVLITWPGNGNDLPSLDAINFSQGIAPSEIPTSIECVGAPIVYTVALRLEAVGRDIDQSIKPINDLSYKPENGWGSYRLRGYPLEDLVVPAQSTNLIQTGFGEIQEFPTEQWNPVKAGVMTREEIRQLAMGCLWRYWRITLEDPHDSTKKVTVPGLQEDYPNLTIDSIFDLELIDRIMHAVEANPQYKPFMIPLQVYGEIQQGIQPYLNPFMPLDLTAPGEALRGIGFTVDNDQKLLVSDKLLLKMVKTDGLYKDESPSLVVVLSVMVRDKIGGLVRYRRTEQTGSDAQTAPMPFIHDDMQFVRMVTYDTNNWWTVTAQRSNKEAVEKMADYYLEGHKYQFQWPKSASNVYPGIVLIENDGAIRQVSWSVGGLQPTTTEASLNSEHNVYIPSYEQLRFQQRVKYFTDPVRSLNVNEAKQNVENRTPGNGSTP
jgi:hypothetical protein